MRLNCGHITMKEIKNICFVKSKDVDNHITITEWLKEFRSGCKNLDNQADSITPETEDSCAPLQVVSFE